jgi:regulator of protease activity HflC (stomatin/prohibitin superfamily)
MPDFGTTFVLVVFVLFLLILLGSAIRVVPEYQRLVVFRFGRVIGAKGPGLVLLIPFVDRGERVDLRERFFDVEPQAAITKDNAPLSIDFLVYMKVINPLPSVLEVEDYTGAARGIAKTTLRALVGDMLLDDVLAKRDQLNENLQGKLDDVTNRWGIKVTAVEIREIIPPRDIQEAMSRQMSAERLRRAVITEAEGRRESVVTVAEGEKKARILNAEGEKQARILQAEGNREAEITEAEGERQAAILRAQGFADALQRIYETARGVDNNTMSLQYLDTLAKMGQSEATKYILPMEFTNLIRPFIAHTSESGQDGAK